MQTRNFEYFVPGNSTVKSTCVDKFLREKKASMKISNQGDILQLNFTAPPVYGDDISLIALDFTINVDKSKFPDIANGSKPSTERNVDKS